MHHAGVPGVTTLYATRGSGNSFKPALALRQLGIPHDIRLVDVLSGETRASSFLTINPLGQVPYLVDANGVGLSQSNAILWHIAEGSHLLPARPAERAQMLQWMFFEQTQLEPGISPARFYTVIVPDREHEFAREIPQWRSKARTALAILNDHFAVSDFVVPSHGYSIGDIALYGYGHLASEAGVDLADFAHVSRWIRRVENTMGFVSLEDIFTPKYSPIMAVEAA